MSKHREELTKRVEKNEGIKQLFGNVHNYKDRGVAQQARAGLENYIGELRGLKDDEARDYGKEIMGEAYGDPELFEEKRNGFETINTRYTEKYLRSNLDVLLNEVGEGLAGYLTSVNPHKDAVAGEEYENRFKAHEKYNKSVEAFGKTREDPSEAYQIEISEMETSVKKSLDGYDEEDVKLAISLIGDSIGPEMIIRKAQRKAKRAEGAFRSLFKDVNEARDYVRANVKYGIEHSDPKEVGQAYQYVPFLIKQEEKEKKKEDKGKKDKKKKK